MARIDPDLSEYPPGPAGLSPCSHSPLQSPHASRKASSYRSYPTPAGQTTAPTASSPPRRGWPKTTSSTSEPCVSCLLQDLYTGCRDWKERACSRPEGFSAQVCSLGFRFSQGFLFEVQVVQGPSVCRFRLRSRVCGQGFGNWGFGARACQESNLGSRVKFKVGARACQKIIF